MTSTFSQLVLLLVVLFSSFSQVYSQNATDIISLNSTEYQNITDDDSSDANEALSILITVLVIFGVLFNGCLICAFICWFGYLASMKSQNYEKVQDDELNLSEDSISNQIDQSEENISIEEEKKVEKEEKETTSMIEKEIDDNGNVELL